MNMKDIKAVFGANVKHYRKKQCMSQEQLSEKLGISQKHLSAIETGSTFVSAELLEKCTRLLHVSAPALFYSGEEISNDDNLLSKIDQVIDKECEKTSNTIKMQIRYLSSQ